jgi:hypothetical protein
LIVKGTQTQIFDRLNGLALGITWSDGDSHGPFTAPFIVSNALPTNVFILGIKKKKKQQKQQQHHHHHHHHHHLYQKQKNNITVVIDIITIIIINNKPHSPGMAPTSTSLRDQYLQRQQARHTASKRLEFFISNAVICDTKKYITIVKKKYSVNTSLKYY